MEKSKISRRNSSDQRYFSLQFYLVRLFSGLTIPNIIHIIKTIGFLTLFLLAFPLTLSITVLTLIIHIITRKPQPMNPNAKRILLTNAGKTKTLQLARSFYSAGHYVVLTESYSFATNRYSRCIAQFYQCPSTLNELEYIQSIVEIVKREKIDFFVPVSHSSSECLDARVKEALIPLNCRTIHGDIQQVNMLSHKYAFIDRARSFGLTVPKSYLITDPKQIFEFNFSKEKCQFILKSIEYDFVNRMNLVKLPCSTREQLIDYVNTLTINQEFPWIMQEFISGKEYCTHGTVLNGELRLHTCCPSSSWLLNYQHLDNKLNVLKWIEEFCSRANLTGQASFDFIESDENGLIYPLECNARTHTAITVFYNQPRVAEAYFGTEPLLDGPIQPKSNARSIYWLYHELWNIFKIRSMKDFIRQSKIFLNGKEALFSVEDPLPFFLHYTIHLPGMILYHLQHMIYFNKIDCNLSFCF